MSWAERTQQLNSRPQNNYRRHHQQPQQPPQQSQNQQSGYVQPQPPYHQPYSNANNNNPSAAPRYQPQPPQPQQTSSHQPLQPPQPQNTQINIAQINQQTQPQTQAPTQNQSSLQTQSQSLNANNKASQSTQSATSNAISSSINAQTQNANPNQESNNLSPVDTKPAPKTLEGAIKPETVNKTPANDNKASIDNKEDTDIASQQSLASLTTSKKKPPFSSLGVNSKMFFGTRYEVKCDETFAYYEGYVFDYDEKEEKLKVSYPWKPDQSVPVNYVRPLALPLEANWKPKQGDHVECQAKAEESEPYGWWDCTIKTVRDNLYLITYEGWDNHHEVLQHNMLRPYNDQEPFEDEHIIREYLTISRDRISEFKSGADLSSQQHNSMHLMFGRDLRVVNDEMQRAETSMSQLKRIAQQTQLIHLNYSPSEEKLVLIGNKRRVYDAKMLIKFVWNLRELYKKKEEQVKLEEKTKQREYDELSKCVCIRFEFNISLTKYVIGTKGENIQRAKQIKQVRHINVRNVNEETSECLILATDANAAEEARNILEMQQDFELIPAKVRKALIGKDGQQIQQLEQRSHVIKICTLEHLKYIRDSSRDYYNSQGDDGRRGRFNPSFIDEAPSADPSFVKLVIIGPKEKVPFAKMLIKLQVESIEQKRKFIERQNIAKQEINQSSNAYGGGGGGGGGNEYYNEYNNGRGGGGGYEHYGDGGDGYYNGQGQSKRRQRKHQTQRSNKDTGDFNYTQQPQQGGNVQMNRDNAAAQGNNADYPSLSSNANKAGGGGKDMEEAGNNAQMSWNDIDAAGIAEDEQEQNEHEQQQQQQQQRDRRDYGGNRRRGKGGKGGGGGGGRYDNRGRRANTYNKPVWKAKTNASKPPEATTSNE